MRQVQDLAEKLESSQTTISRQNLMIQSESVDSTRRFEDRLAKAEKDASKTTIEVIHGLISQAMKVMIFDRVNNAAND